MKVFFEHSARQVATYEGRDLEAMARARNYQRWILREFAPYVGAVVAEVGAGSGNLSRQLLEGGLQQLVAVEPSAQMNRRLQRRLGGDPRTVVHQAFFPDLCEQYPEHFDSVIYVNVLEHVTDDARELACAWRALKPGGHVCLFVPALPWLYSAFDAAIGHHRRYRYASLNRLLQEVGFEVVKLRYFDLVGILPWFLYFTGLKRRRLPGSSVVAYDRALVPLLRRLEAIIPVSIGKNLVAVGRK